MDSDFGCDMIGVIQREDFVKLNWIPNLTRCRPCLLKLHYDFCGFLEDKIFEEYSNNKLKQLIEDTTLEYIYEIRQRSFTLKNISQLFSYFYLGYNKDKGYDIIIKCQHIQDYFKGEVTDFMMPISTAMHSSDLVRMFENVIAERYANTSVKMDFKCTCGNCLDDSFPICCLDFDI